MGDGRGLADGSTSWMRWIAAVSNDENDGREGWCGLRPLLNWAAFKGVCSCGRKRENTSIGTEGSYGTQQENSTELSTEHGYKPRSLPERASSQQLLDSWELATNPQEHANEHLMNAARALRRTTNEGNSAQLPVRRCWDTTRPLATKATEKKTHVEQLQGAAVMSNELMVSRVKRPVWNLNIATWYFGPRTAFSITTTGSYLFL